MLMLLDENNASSQCRIMARELADPTPALDQIVREAIAPLHKFLGKLVCEIMGDRSAKPSYGVVCTASWGSVYITRHTPPVLLRLNPKLRYDNKEIQAIAKHIAGFSLAGIQSRSDKSCT